MKDDYKPIEYTSRKIMPGPVVDVRPHLKLANTKIAPAFNTRIPRFTPKQWVVDYNALMVATIIPIGANSFKVPAQWRTNSDFLGVRWISKDDLNHHYFKYETNNDYAGMVLAFRSNPTAPDRFTVTITAAGEPYTYRLAPYALNSLTNLYECLDVEYGTKRTYPANSITPAEFNIPVEEMFEYKGRKDYIFIIDFNDLRTLSSFTGPIVSPRNVSMISFDCVEASHGLGQYAYMSSMVQLPNNEVRMELGGVLTNAILTEGDKLQAIWRWYDPAVMVEQFAESEFVVKSYSGFGTSALTVIVEGTLPGVFAGCDAFYGRYLQMGVPAGITNSVKYFCDMTMTGGKQTIGKRHYPQEVNNQGMTAGFDDGYNLTPDRQVEMAYALGYRNWWTTYIGMSHYFNGQTAFQHKVTGELVLTSEVLSLPILFAGEAGANIHFTTGKFPNRGVDAFQQSVTQEFGVAYGAIEAFDGATGSSAADRMAAPELDRTLYWWDLETNTPGPCLLKAIEVMEDKIPKVVIWSQGSQDASFIAFPTGRVPLPSVARTKLATEKVFEYFRSKWGGTLKIMIQELGNSWSVPNPSQPEVPILKGQPTYMDVTRNTWGDLVFTWLSYGDDPKDYRYKVELYDPAVPTRVMRTLNVPGTQIDDRGLVFCDYPIEVNVADAVAAFGDQLPWTFIRWRVVRTDNAMVSSGIVETLVQEDNASFVKQTCILGINSLIGGYFNDLSDPLNPGGTGRPGRKDVVAASTFRKALASNAGLRDVQVMPVMAVVGSSPINPMPYQAGFDLQNYWWDAPNNKPGPNLIYADAIVKALKIAPSFFVESGPGETTGIPYAPEADRPAILAAWRTSNIAMLAWMRTNWGNPTLPIWFQGATTSFWGTEIPPADVNAAGAEWIRTLQTSMSLENIGFKVGSYVPNGGSYKTFLNEMADGLGWVHYTVDGYHAAAAEMGEAIALDINRATLPPDWVLMRQPTNLKIVTRPNRDIHFSWTARAGVTKWFYRNLRGDTQAVLSTGVIDQASFTFTAAEQTAAYGNTVDYVIFEVSEYLEANDLIGPPLNFAGSPGTGDLRLPENLVSTLQLNGDIITTWDVRPGHTDFYYRNILANTGMVITEGPLTSPSYNFTVAAQIAAYGGPTSYSRIEVSEYDVTNQSIGPAAVWNDTAVAPSSPLAPIVGFEAHFSGADVIMTWTASAVEGRQYRFRNLRADSGAEFQNVIVDTPTYNFTTAQQIAEYGYTVGYIHVLVCEYDPTTGVDGPVHTYNGSPT